MITMLSQLIALVESGDNPYAIRQEPAYHFDMRAFPNARKAQPGLSYGTYVMICSTSWGKYQIMGDNLYLLGLDVPIVQFGNDIARQDMFFHRFIESRNIAYSLEDVVNIEASRLDFAHHYNGSPQAYGARMMAIYSASLPPKPVTNFVKV